MTSEVARHLAPLLDGINIDLKSFNPAFYQQVCGARLEPVLENIRLLYQLGVLVEVTTLLIPGLNDSEEELRAIARFLKSVSPDLAWHVSAFRPQYKMTDRPSTPRTSLANARAIGLAEGLHFVYEGNTPESDGVGTFCPGCGALLIKRAGFSSQVLTQRAGCCDRCGTVVAGVWA
jgi:pyruvate formate lyase activating enzyme